MRPACVTTPARLWRAFFIAAFAAWTAFAASPPTRPPELAQVGKPDAAEAAKLLEQFRQSGVPGDYFLEFELHALPRRGEERVFQGKLWGTRNEQGSLTRVELVDGAGLKHRLLVQNGERGFVSKFEAGKVTRLSVAELFHPIIPGVEITPFDVQMPFLYWPDATLEKISRVRGRPANAFLFRAPASFTAQHDDVAAARAYLDGQFNALMQTELIGSQGKVVKTFSLLNLKTVNKQPLPKSADYRNEVTRDKTRLVVTAAAVNLQHPASVFAPESLGGDAPTPAPLVRL